MKDVKIIGISGTTEDIAKIFIEDYGGDRFIEKPFSASDFKVIVSELLKEC
jgi:DNA-binding response OmpR family regulator